MNQRPLAFVHVRGRYPQAVLRKPVAFAQHVERVQALAHRCPVFVVVRRAVEVGGDGERFGYEAFHVVRGQILGVSFASAVEEGRAVLHRGAPFPDGEAAAPGIVRPAVAQSFQSHVVAELEGVEPFRPPVRAAPRDPVADHLAGVGERVFGGSPAQPGVDGEAFPAHAAYELVLAARRLDARGHCRWRTVRDGPRAM